MIRLDGVVVLHFGGKDVFVGYQLDVAAKSQICSLGAQIL